MSQFDRPRSAGGSLGAAGLVAALCAGLLVLPRLFPRHEAALVGLEAPDFRLDVIANAAAAASAPLAIRELRGRAVLLDFWATWCGPCRAEAPIVDEVSRRWRDRGVVVVGVDTDSADQGDPREFARDNGLSYPIVHDESGAVSRAYGVEGLPTLVVVSRAGKVLAVRTGVTDASELDDLLRQAL